MSWYSFNVIVYSFYQLKYLNMKRKSKAKIIISLIILAVALWAIAFYINSGDGKLNFYNPLTAQVSGSVSSSGSSSITIVDEYMSNFDGTVRWTTKDVGPNWIGQVYVKDGNGNVIFNSGNVISGRQTSYNDIIFGYLEGGYTVGVLMTSPNGLKKVRDTETGSVSGLNLDLSVSRYFVSRGDDTDIEWNAYSLPSTWRGELRLDGRLVDTLSTSDSRYTVENSGCSGCLGTGSHEAEVIYSDPYGRYQLREEENFMFN